MYEKKYIYKENGRTSKRNKIKRMIILTIRIIIIIIIIIILESK